MAATRPQRAAIYARVSTLDQTTENQLTELRSYTLTRGWTAREYVDEGVSGSIESRPALDRLLRDARRRRFDVLVCWRLDRLGRSLKHLILFLEELSALGVAFVSLAEGIDATTPAGRLQMHILGAIAEFERARIAERVRARALPERSGRGDCSGAPAWRSQRTRSDRWRDSRRATRRGGWAFRRRRSAACANNLYVSGLTFAPDCSAFRLVAVPTGLRENHMLLAQAVRRGVGNPARGVTPGNTISTAEHRRGMIGPSNDAGPRHNAWPLRDRQPAWQRRHGRCL